MKNFWTKTKKWMKKNNKQILITVMLFLLFYPFMFSDDSKSEIKEVPYGTFNQMMKDKKVESVKINLSAPAFVFEGKDKVIYQTENPKDLNFKKDLLEAGVKVTEVDPKESVIWQETVASIIKLAVTMLLFLWIFSLFQKRLGKNKKSEVSQGDMPKITFADIAGQDEAKEEMQFLVDFLKHPKKYAKMGAKLPKGAIFYGDPGTGKTLTAKAIAGEAKVPFFSMSGSDFVEMYVGLGASRVRDLFEEARKKAPAIIFIDEIDAIGAKRDGVSGTSEDRKTLNAILNEMDGFNSSEGIIVIGATNRLEDLDPALIRPGRFDKHIAIPLPDQKGRVEILKVHARNKPIGPDVDFEAIAKMTINFSGASLESLLNESAIIATTRIKEYITMQEIDDAFYKVVMQGHKKKNSDKRDDKVLRLVAWHEAGHALVAKLLTDISVPKVTIIASTSGAGGVTFFSPSKRGLFTKDEMMSNVKISYGGRVAEYLLLGDENKITTGASSDIKQATSTIMQIINDYGMSDEFGMLNLTKLGGVLHSPVVNNSYVEEAKKLSKQLYNETLALLTSHKDLLEAIANELLEKETLSEHELDEVIARYSNKITMEETQALAS